MELWNQYWPLIAILGHLTSRVEMMRRTTLLTLFVCGACVDSDARDANRGVVVKTSTSVIDDSAEAKVTVPTWAGHVDTLRLSESGAHMIVSPIRVVQDGHDILVVDPKESRLAAFDSMGNLRWELARKGKGPGELELPISVAPTSEGYWIADIFNGLFLVDKNSREEIRRLRPGSNALQGILAIDDSTLVLVGRGGPQGKQETWIHAINTHDGKSRWNAIPVAPLTDPASRSLTFASISRWRDRLLLTISLVDTIYMVGLDGAVLARRAAHIVDRSSVAHLGRERPSPRALADVVRLTGAYLLDDSTMVASFQRGSARAPRYGMALLREGGASATSTRTFPGPLIVGNSEGVLYGAFADPERPNVLVRFEGMFQRGTP
ncbi:hypothetical protein [Gemmatimonas aurantiaca]|uniref:hypothetical protein n=1 Tax=Gemmatimonas aurantiaca TaxID=173480 RepID=UPI00301E4C71